MGISIGAPVRPEHGRADSALRWAEVGGKKIFILVQTGGYADICHDHGALLAEEIATGVFPEILDTVLTSTDVGDGFLTWVPAAIYRRISDEIFDACSDEFRAGADALHEGFSAMAPSRTFSRRDVHDAVVAIDAGNCAEGLVRRLEKPWASEVSETIGYVIGAAISHRPPRTSRFVRNTIAAQRLTVAREARRLSRIEHRVGFGCTGAGSAGARTEDGRALHARTFDGAFFAWNAWPGLFLIDERATNPAWHRYAAVGTAGLTYSGGISGLNDAGLAASIHQMSTARYDTGRPARGYALAPYLMQRILREAGSLDAAHAILAEARHFGSWTIVVSDAKAGAAARFEINGGTQSVTRTDLGDSFAQSNHFLADETAERHRFFDDLHFTPSFGKWLESRARLETVTRAMAQAEAAGAWGTDAAIGLLASHADGALDGAPRSFGRTIAKAYGIMGTVARCDPDRTRADDEIWMSVGNAQPGPHGDFAGFAIDWDAMTVRPVADRPVRQAGTLSSAMAASSADYVQAFATMARPRDARGGYLGCDPTPGERRVMLDQARQLLDRAARRAEDAGEIDYAFRYARARLAHQAGDFDAAEDDWSFLRALSDARGVPMLDYERALVLILSAATAFARGAVAEAKGHLTKGEALLAQVRAAHFGSGRAHGDLETWQKIAAALSEKGAGADLPEFDFVTVE